MSKIRVERTHSLGVDGAKERLANVEIELNKRYGVRLTWSGNNAQVKGSGVKGTLSVEAGSVCLELSLGLLLRPLSAKIRQAIEDTVDKELA